MSNKQEQIAVEAIKQRDDVQRALKRTSSTKQEIKPPVETKHKFWLGTYLLLLVSLAGLYYLFRLQFFGFVGKYVPLVQRLTLGSMAVIVALGVARMVDAFFIDRLDDAVSRYNLRRILKLVAAVALNSYLADSSNPPVRFPGYALNKEKRDFARHYRST